MSDPSLDTLLAQHAIVAHHVLESAEQAAEHALALRMKAAAGERVLLALRPRRSPWTRVAALWTKSKEPDAVEALAAALLCAGFDAPTLAAEHADWIAVFARAPSREDPLDDVFRS